jgi:hypothetical protein
MSPKSGYPSPPLKPLTLDSFTKETERPPGLNIFYKHEAVDSPQNYSPKVEREAVSDPEKEPEFE